MDKQMKKCDSLYQLGKAMEVCRIRRNLSAAALCSGICAAATLSRIEYGDRVADKFILEALLQRLGWSPDKLDTIYYEEDYGLIALREEIEHALVEGNYSLASVILGKYEKIAGGMNVHRQYVCKVQAILEAKQQNNTAGFLTKIYQAIRISQPNFPDLNWDKVVFYHEEIQILLMYALYRGETGEREEAIEMIRHLTDCLDRSYSDMEEKVKIYPKVIYFLAICYLEDRNYQALIECTSRGLDLLTSNTVLFCLPELLKLHLAGLFFLRDKDTFREMKGQWDTLKAMYAESGVTFLSESFLFLFNNSQKEMFLASELVQNRREAQGMSPEDFCDGICEILTLERAEAGKYPMKKTYFDRYMVRLGLNLDFYNSHVYAYDMQYMEMKREFERQMQMKNFGEAYEIWTVLANELDWENERNEQFLVKSCVLLDFVNKKTSPKRTRYELFRMLRVTLKEYQGVETIPNLVLFREEAFILCNIATTYEWEKNLKPAIEILEAVVASYEKRRVSEKYYLVPYLLACANLAFYLEIVGEVTKSLELAKKAIRISIVNGRGSMLSFCLSTLACCMEKKYEKQAEKKEKACLHYAKQAFSLSQLLHQTNRGDAIHHYMSSNYNILLEEQN